MHADRPGDRPRLLYWYRTAPGIALGRPPLDEDAIRTIEEQHPDIEFDWPAILALSEVMMPEEEEAPRQKPNAGRRPGRESARGSASARRENAGELRRDERVEESRDALEPAAQEQTSDSAPQPAEDAEPDLDERDEEAVAQPHHHVSGLLEELVGREIATRLRARYSEIQARIHERHVDPPQRDAWLKRAETLNPDLWLTPDAILEGVRNADTLFARLHGELKN